MEMSWAELNACGVQIFLANHFFFLIQLKVSHYGIELVPREEI